MASDHICKELQKHKTESSILLTGPIIITEDNGENIQLDLKASEINRLMFSRFVMVSHASRDSDVKDLSGDWTARASYPNDAFLKNKKQEKGHRF